MPASATAAPVAQEEADFDIPAQDLGAALNLLARQANIRIAFPVEMVAHHRSVALKGRMAPIDAVRRLVAPLPLKVVQSTSGAIMVLGDAKGRQHGKGTITGRIIDPATKEYLRDAIVEVTMANGDRRTVTTAEDGEYRLVDAAAGPAEITVRYTGYADQSANVDVAEGRTVHQDFALQHSDQTGLPKANDIVVVGVRDGDARAIMSQRQSMDIKDSLSAESYGDIADGNPGEFIKYMPGVDTDADGDGDGTVRNINLRGMPSDYTAVTLNGVSLAGVDAMTGAAGSRTFSFEQMSLSSIDSIEISKTISADVDANAPAGTINIKTKRAFDRKGRRILLQFGASTHADLWDSKKRTGPGEGGYGGKRFFPNWQAEYSDVLLGGRLGVVASVSKSDLYIEHEQTTLGRSNKPTAVSPDPLAITSIETQQDAREISRLSATFNADFKASDQLVLSLVSVYNKSGIWAASTSYKFITGARSQGVIGDPLFDITTDLPPTTSSLSMQNSLNYKDGEGKTFVPSFEYDNGRLTLDGNINYSSSTSRYDPEGKKDSAYVMSALTATGNFSAQREPGNLFGQEWQIQQLSGGDWSDPASFSGPKSLVLRLNNGASAKRTQTGGALNATYRLAVGSVPVSLKTGFKNARSKWVYADDSDNDRYQYVGSMSVQDMLAQVQSSNQVSFADSGITIHSLNGSEDLYIPSEYKVLDFFHQHPDYWEATQSSSATEWYGVNVGNNRNFSEETNALYVMATASPGDKVKVRAGLRWEQTQTTSLEVDPLSAQEVVDAGYPVSASTGQATTIEGLEYQYLSQPKVRRKGKYDHFFPSASIKYSYSPTVDLQIGYSRTIRRPAVSDLTGIWSIDDLDKVIRAPNPGLKPEISDNLSVRLSKYFEPVGFVAINYYQNRVKGLFETQDLTAEEFGYTGTEYADYTFRTTTTVGGNAVNIRGWELEFNHALKYLPSPLDGLSVRGSVSMNYPEIPIVGVADKMANFSVSYKKGPVRLYLNTAWTGKKYRSTTPSYYADFWDVSLSGALAVTHGVETFFAVRNLLNSARNVIVSGSTVTAGPVGDYSAVYLKAGISGKIGIRARF